MARKPYPNPVPVRDGNKRASTLDVIERIRTRWPEYDGSAIDCPVHGKVAIADRYGFATSRNMNCPACEKARCSPPTVEEMRNKLRHEHPNLDWPEPSWTENQGRNRKVMAHCTIHGIAWVAPVQFHKNGSHKCPACFPSGGRVTTLYRSKYFAQKDLPEHIERALKNPE